MMIINTKHYFTLPTYPQSVNVEFHNFFIKFLSIIVLLEFFEQKKRKPLPSSRDEDLAELLKLRDEFIEKNGIAKDRIPDDFFEYLQILFYMHHSFIIILRVVNVLWLIAC